MFKAIPSGRQSYAPRSQRYVYALVYHVVEPKAAEEPVTALEAVESGNAVNEAVCYLFSLMIIALNP